MSVKYCKYCKEEFLKTSHHWYIYRGRFNCRKKKHLLNKKSFKKRLKEDLNSRIKYRLHYRLEAYKSDKIKPHFASKYLGCSIQEFREYVEQKWTSEMSWENYGKYWNLDHIYPLSKINWEDMDAVKYVLNFRNIQPLLVAENSRKSNKIAKDLFITVKN
jgi:hypothetical protein